MNAAEHRLALGGDEPLTHAEGVDLGPLKQQIPDDVLVQELEATILHWCSAPHPASCGPCGQISEVAAVQPDGAVGNALRSKISLNALMALGNTGSGDVKVSTSRVPEWG